MKGNGYLAKVCACVLILGLLSGCEGSDESPMNTLYVEEECQSSPVSTPELEKEPQGSLYESLSEVEQEYYAHLCAAVENFEDEATFTFETPEDRLAIMETFWGGDILPDGTTKGGRRLVREVWYEQAQYFWVDPNCFSYAVRDYPDDDRYLLIAKLNYLMDEDTAMAVQEQFDNQVEEIVFQAKAAGDTFDQIRYVHDYLCEHVVYDEELSEAGEFDSPTITAYGALMEGTSICSGYTMAFSLLLRELGYDVWVEFNNYGETSTDEGHVWNYVQLDGEYYYFDVTWDDVGTEDFDYTYEYFGITAQELKLSNDTKQDNAPVPNCQGTQYNYFVHEGYDIPQYSFEAATPAITKQLQEGNSRISLRFGSYEELLQAEQDLITNQRIYELIDVDSVTYYISESPKAYLYIDI